MYYEGNSELYHYGVQGMHWGVRRYQNPDGTLTDAGKRRAYQKSDEFRSKVNRAKHDIKSNPEYKKTKIKSVAVSALLTFLTNAAFGNAAGGLLLAPVASLSSGIAVNSGANKRAKQMIMDEYDVKMSELNLMAEQMEKRQ